MRWIVLFAAALALSPVAGQGSPTAQRAFDQAIGRAKAAMLTSPAATFSEAQRAEKLAESLRTVDARGKARATALWLEAEAFYRLDDIEHAAPRVEQAHALARQSKDLKLQADILLTRGAVHAKRLQVAEALKDFQAAHSLFRASGDQRHEAIALICIANLYTDAGDNDSALRYLREALEAYNADAGLAQAIYNARGVGLLNQGKYGAAETAFRQAFNLARSLKSAALQGIMLRNLARTQLLAGHTEAAEHSIHAARNVAQGREELAQVDGLAAQLAVQRREPAQAVRLIDRVFRDVDLTRTDGRFRYAHLTAVAAYRLERHADRALAHLEAVKRIDDEAVKLATQTSTALMAARFDSANQEAKIARLRDAERLRQAREEVQRARAERTMWLGGAGATTTIIILLLIGITAIRRSRDQVRAANADLAVTNGALGKALAAKTEFLATTSHEIRTPLNGILGMTQVMLADGALAPATRDRLTVVHGAGLTMRALVDDILDVAKMETGHMALETAPFALRAMLEEASRMWAEQARAKGLTFILDVDRCPARVAGDAARVRQIVFNLLSNALKFTAEGSVSLLAEAVGDGVRIAIADTGIGIAPDQQAAVFESFRQADASTTRKFGGTGLGLSICRSLAEAMGGGVTLRSRPGRGSTFTVDLPLTALPAEAPVPAVSVAGETLLVVDRNPIARAMFRTLFAPHGAVAFAGSAEEADAFFVAGQVTRVLIDDATARAGGDARAFIAALIGKTDGARISLLWPAGAEAEQRALLALGVDEVIAKPVTGADLVNRLFRQHRGIAQQTPLVPKAA